jgi:hypothetical protein
VTTRGTILATTALICSIVALIMATWAAVTSMRTRDDIRRLGEILERGRPGAGGSLQLDAIHPPELDPDDR